MASIVKRRGKWYARVSLYAGRQREKQIPLRTERREEALVRLSKIERVENDIKNGIEFTFPWMNDENEHKVKRYALSLAIKEYIQHRKLLNLRPTTISQNEFALKHFKLVVGKKFPVQGINSTHIEKFMRKYKSKHAATTINMNLRAIKTFFSWLKEEGYMDSPPKIKQLSVDNSMPLYITEKEFINIQKQDWLSDHYKSVFNLYIETGMRLSEPFAAELDGNILTILSGKSKTRYQRQIELNDNQAQTVKDMQDKLGLNPPKYKIDNYSKVFKKACKGAGIEKHFHCIRHTFAVMEYLRSRDIYWVSKMLGHSSVTTTEVYAKFHTRKLEQDFPSVTAKI